jgi:hypothetical protein
MATNVFDKAARYAAKLDPAEFLAWALDRPPAAFDFRQWLDTRLIPFPGGDDRTGDTVAGVDNRESNGVPWAVAVEFQLEPDPLMFGRLLVYLGGIWLGIKSDSERGSRYHLGAVVVNLTGRGAATREFGWADAGLTTHLGVREWNLETESAADLLGKIETAVHSRGLLPWIPLMTGADEAGIVERWKRVAEAEPDTRRRSEYAGLAKVFADAAGRKELWVDSLERWNMRESSVVNGWIEEGRVEGHRVGQIELLEAMLTTRFGPLSDANLSALRALPDDRLRGLSVQLLSAKSLAELGL